MSNAVKVLVIDDEPVIVESVVRLCSSEGLDVDSALDAQEALKKIERNTYELIITDIMMPEMDGFQFLSTIRQRNIQTPVIITTGYSTVENAVKSLSEGAIDFLPKPFTFEELISCTQRGLKYGQILKSILSKKMPGQINDEFVPCPMSYYRLGYNTWTYPDDDGSVKTGVTDLFLKTIGSVKKLQLFQPDEEIFQGNMCAQIETDAELIHNILAPVSGRIMQRNEALISEPSLIEKDPFFEGWIYRVLPSHPDKELSQLMPCSSNQL
jgi:CheY-like chemotaxis protein